MSVEDERGVMRKFRWKMFLISEVEHKMLSL